MRGTRRGPQLALAVVAGLAPGWQTSEMCAWVHEKGVQMGKQVEGPRASRRARRSWTPSFKAEVVAWVRQGDRTLPAICRELDLSEAVVRHGVQQAAVDARDREGRRRRSARSCGAGGGRYGCSATRRTSPSERRRASRGGLARAPPPGAGCAQRPRSRPRPRSRSYAWAVRRPGS